MKPNRCRAHSSRTGKPCKRPPIAGAVVCRAHGAGAPQVQASALARLALLQPHAINALDSMLKGRNGHVRLGAAKDVLDRTLGRPATSVQVSGELAIEESGWPGLSAMPLPRLDRFHQLVGRFEDGEPLSAAEQLELRDLNAEARRRPLPSEAAPK